MDLPEKNGITDIYSISKLWGFMVRFLSRVKIIELSRSFMQVPFLLVV